MCGILFAGLGIVPIIEPMEQQFNNWFQRHSMPIHLGCTGLGFLMALCHVNLSVTVTKKIGEMMSAEDKEDKEEKEQWLALSKKRNMTIYALFACFGVLALWGLLVSMMCGKMQMQGEVLFESTFVILFFSEIF